MLHENWTEKRTLFGNFKDKQKDKVAELVGHEEVASYHTMVVPYGPKCKFEIFNYASHVFLALRCLLCDF